MILLSDRWKIKRGRSKNGWKEHKEFKKQLILQFVIELLMMGILTSQTRKKIIIILMILKGKK